MNPGYERRRLQARALFRLQTKGPGLKPLAIASASQRPEGLCSLRKNNSKFEDTLRRVLREELRVASD
jgi:hypothetical protein